MSKFKLGDKVVRVKQFHSGTWERFKKASGLVDNDIVTVTAVDSGNGAISVNGFEDRLDKFPFAASFFGMVEPGTTKPTVAAWDFSEAQRLRDAAKAAVEAYNDYVANKPEDTYLKVYNPFQD